MNKPQRFLSNRFLRLHLIVIYLLLLGLTIVWTLFYLYLIRIIRFQHFEYNRIEKRLLILESKLITITAVNHDDIDLVDRQTTYPRTKSDQMLSGSIHFQVPVRNSIFTDSSEVRFISLFVADCDEFILWQIRRVLQNFNCQ